MAIGRRPESRQHDIFVAASEIRAGGSPFYRGLDRLLRENGFDGFAEEACREFYAGNRGRPGVPPGVYFRMLMAGYLEGTGSERGIAWRCADSFSPREFLGYGLAENPPEHSTLSKTRKRLSVAYSDDAGHQFRQADHRFRSMPITLEERRSIAALGGRVTGLKFRG